MLKPQCRSTPRTISMWWWWWI